MTTERFILRTTLTSPFGRKARMAVEALGLADRVTVVPADPGDENDSLRRENPLGKMPCLVRADGSTVFDSGVILEFLQEVAGTRQLVPAAGMERIRAQTLARLADGIIDAGASMIYEEKWHAPEQCSPTWLAHQRGKILRGLAAFEAAPPEPRTTDAVTIGLACVLGFLDRRQQVQWRPQFPQLVAWLEAFSAHEPAFERTRAPAA